VQGAGDNAGRDFDALFRERYADLRALADQRRRQHQRGTLLDTTAAHRPSGRAGRERTGNRRSPPPWSPCQISICPRRPTSRRRAERIQSPANRLCYRLMNDNMVAAQVLYEACAREAVADAVRRLYAAIRLADK